MRKEKLNLTLRPETIQALKLQSAVERRPASEIVEELVGTYLRRFEDFHKAMEKTKK
jgi:predicted DNA-binding protein